MDRTFSESQTQREISERELRARTYAITTAPEVNVIVQSYDSQIQPCWWSVITWCVAGAYVTYSTPFG